MDRSIWVFLNVPVERAGSCTLDDFEGNEYTDLFSGMSVVNVGQGTEAIVAESVMGETGIVVPSAE
ncbi:aminotransferase class III-fold pyridoxal phosphate-dependent enzyme [Natrialba swarupiae]|uniref:Aminotransferase class III-fold pyridoxal phosphate-dependent enzyme n=1 Tax=Natrialba swarupiae TaxID=2448032 RepID=A0A5D5AHA6_9EURY|nr:aminotransferase class III-fold pyridoxal phosphate-dependent enzyme [Natrialba swarupiae]MCW8173252.1 aminotransferase class III-fold pyridoxal phosphate-dependent enzyme [Natrialba swarupiae]TYT60405.1 aminotransferase class III-fold pyridoxal phosphate-dependent enzyme [Natrialba swarupiae]